MYLNPEDVDIKDPPIIVNSIKNNDKSRFDEWVVIPTVDIEVVDYILLYILVSEQWIYYSFITCDHGSGWKEE